MLELIYTLLYLIFPQQEFAKLVIGQVALTTYNNKTYRIDDVTFKLNPTHTFTKKNGEQISYVNYYQDVYKIKIRDIKQPLLISRAKARDRRAGQDELIYLIPELCIMTGKN